MCRAVIHTRDIPIKRRRKALTVARDMAASLTALGAYVPAAWCVGWLVSRLLEPLGHAWPRFALEAAISTVLGVLASRQLTNSLFPVRSGKLIVATFAIAVLVAVIAGGNHPMSLLHASQSLLLVGLAYGLFWPHQQLGH
mgnify:CR=1 FL=1